MGSLDFFCKPTFNNISEEKRNKILSVAINEFACNGFENANINTIAKKAQVSVGSLYKYFDTKTDLFLTSVNYGIQNLEAVMEEVIVSDVSIMEKFERLIRIAIESSRRDNILIKLYNVVTSQTNSAVAGTVATQMESLTCEAYKRVIADGQAQGEIRKDIDTGMAAYLVDNILMNIQFTYACDYYKERFKIYSGEDIFENDEVVIANILRFVKAALRA